MASSQFPLAVGSSGAPATASYPITKGTLQAVSVTLEDQTASDLATYVTVYITQGGSSTLQTVANLASGYVTNLNPVGWTGSLSLENSMELRVTAVSSVARSLRIGMTTEV